MLLLVQSRVYLSQVVISPHLFKIYFVSVAKPTFHLRTLSVLLRLSRKITVMFVLILSKNSRNMSKNLRNISNSMMAFTL